MYYPNPVYAVLGIKPRASCTPGRHWPLAALLDSFQFYMMVNQMIAMKTEAGESL